MGVLGFAAGHAHLFNKVVAEIEDLEDGEVLQVLDLLDAVLTEVQLLEAGEHAYAPHGFEPIRLHKGTHRHAQQSLLQALNCIPNNKNGSIRGSAHCLCSSVPMEQVEHASTERKIHCDEFLLRVQDKALIRRGTGRAVLETYACGSDVLAAATVHSCGEFQGRGNVTPGG